MTPVERAGDRPARSASASGRKNIALALTAVAVCAALALWMTQRNSPERLSPTATAASQFSDASDTDALSSAPPDASGEAVLSDDLGEQSTRALKDPNYLRSLISRYSTETDLDQRGALIALLQSVANDEVMRFGMQLAGSNDPATRKDGLRLLQSFPLDRAPVRELLTEQLRDERDPLMQKELLDMLTPAVMPVEDATPLVTELARLRNSPDPDVRAASVLQTPQWDRQSDLEPVLHTALTDPATQVRQAAIAGINTNHLRSPRLKDGLLAIATDPDAPQEERSAAVFALQDFALSRAEYALFREAAGTADMHDHEQDE